MSLRLVIYLLLSLLTTCYKNDLAENGNFTFICTQLRMQSWGCLAHNVLMTWISLTYWVSVVRRPLHKVKWWASVRKRVISESNRWRPLELCLYCIILCTVVASCHYIGYICKKSQYRVIYANNINNKSYTK